MTVIKLYGKNELKTSSDDKNDRGDKMTVEIKISALRPLGSYFFFTPVKKKELHTLPKKLFFLHPEMTRNRKVCFCMYFLIHHFHKQNGDTRYYKVSFCPNYIKLAKEIS